MGLTVALTGGSREGVRNAMVLADISTRAVIAVISIDKPWRVVRVSCEADRAHTRIFRGVHLGRIPAVGEVLPVECFAPKAEHTA